jgi:hypothetical protein
MWTMAYSRKDQPIESDLVGKTVSSAQEVRPLYWRVWGPIADESDYRPSRSESRNVFIDVPFRII